MSLYNLVSAAAAILIAGSIFLLVRRDQLHTRYAIWWIPLAVAVLVVGLFPGLNDRLAWMLGIAYPPVLPLIIGLGMLIIKILLMDVERSRNEQKLHRLTQRLGMLECELLGKSQTADRPATGEESSDD